MSDRPPMKRVYFAAAIRAGRENAELYCALARALSSGNVLLTEQVCDPDRVDEGLSDREIHERDLAMLHRADCVIAEVSVPSLGVGYELGWAVTLRKPVLALYRQGSPWQLSAMVRGCPAIRTLSYVSLSQAHDAAMTFVRSIELPRQGEVATT
jgi:2'-deoxynucleoside 5'-phosphate N-hydrolase